MSGFREMILNILLGFIESFDSNISDAAAVLTSGELFTGGAYQVMCSVQNTIKPVCLIIISICFLIEMVKQTLMLDQIRWEQVLKVLIKLAISKAIIDIAPSVLKLFYLTTADWINGIVATGGNSTLGKIAAANLTSLFEQIKWPQALGIAATLIIPFLIILLCGLIIKVMAYGRMFELYIYIAIAPLPCSFFPLGEGDGNRTTFKFFKSFFAVCLQGLFMVLSMKIFDALVAQSFMSALTSVQETGAPGISNIAYTMLVGSACMTLAITKSGQWAKSILDVN